MPGQGPVLSKKVGEPKKKEAKAPKSEEKKDGKPTSARRRPQEVPYSDSDSGIYQVRSHRLLRRRQPPPKPSRYSRDTYFDRVLNNSDSSSEEDFDHVEPYICRDCKMESGREIDHYRDSRYSKNNKLAASHRMMESRYSERPRRQAVPHRRHSYVPTRLEFSSDSDDSDDRYRQPQARHQKQRPKPPRELKREPMRSRRELDYSDSETTEEEYFSDPSTAVPPRRRPGEGLHKAHRKPHSRTKEEERPRRSNHNQIEVVERKTTTRPSKQNDENDVKIRRKPMPKDKYTESRFMQSDGTDYSDAEYEEMGRNQQHRHHHHFSRRPHGKELQLSDESEETKAFSRPRRRVVDSGNGRKRNAGAATQFKRL